MGFFGDFKKAFNAGRQRAIDESYRRRKQEEKVNIPVELVEPNRERFVTLKITEKDEFLRGIYMKQLSAYARSIKNIYPDAVLTMYEDRVTVEFNSSEEATVIRTSWENNHL